MTAIEILVDEHESILKMIEVTQIILLTEDETTVNLEHVKQVIDFIQNFADKYHHLKEEDLLFMEMEKYGMSREGGPIAVMLHEHNEGRTYIKHAIEALEKLKLNDTLAFDDLKSNLLNYCTLLTNHIGKENNILYPMACQILPFTVQDDMVSNFERTNQGTINNEYFDKYLKLVDELSAIYLNCLSLSVK